MAGFILDSPRIYLILKRRPYISAMQTQHTENEIALFLQVLWPLHH